MPNNQQYIEEIIEVAQEGDWDGTDEYGGEYTMRDYIYSKEKLLLDSLFWKSLSKSWHKKEKLEEDNGENCNCWKSSMHTFLDKIIEKDLDHAIEWLYKLIKE